MLKDILDIVFLYLDMDTYYKIKDQFNLSVIYHCKNIKDITIGSKSWTCDTTFYYKNCIN